MRVLVATKKTQGYRRSDFCHANDGELLTFGSECDDDDGIDGVCGCRRSLKGIETNKATTTFQVVERDDMEMGDIVAMLKAATSPLIVKMYGEEMAEQDAREDARFLSEIANHFTLGAVIERRGNDFVRRA